MHTGTLMKASIGTYKQGLNMKHYAFSYRNISLNDIPYMKERKPNCMKIKASVILRCYRILLFLISILD